MRKRERILDMLGAIAGDIIGSIYEHWPIKTKEFPLFGQGCTFTDDTVLTVAVAKAIHENRPYRDTMLELGRTYPHAGYGANFREWLYFTKGQPYGSWGNGSAMRVSPVGWAFDSTEQVLGEAEKSAEGIAGAQATALAVFLARTGNSKDEIRRVIAERFEYDLDRTVDGIRPAYSFEISCEKTVPEAIIIAFLDSDSYEDAVRNAISLGGDSDTLACITGSIAEAFYGGVPEEIFAEVKGRLDPDLWEATEEFSRKYKLSR